MPIEEACRAEIIKHLLEVIDTWRVEPIPSHWLPLASDQSRKGVSDGIGKA